MYLVVDEARSTYVFCEDDPRLDGCKASAQEDVRLDEPVEEANWTPGVPDTKPYLGRSPQGERSYRIFRTAQDCQRAGYTQLGHDFLRIRSWRQYDDPR